MALYHFTVKTDKRTKDEKRINAVDKIAYINREGKYADLDRKEARDQENLITSEKRTDAFFGKRLYLYTSPFGKILNMEKGLLLSERPSHDTIAIALMIAKESMGDPLIVNGSNRFKAKCVEAAVAADLPISFENKSMQRKLERMRKEKEDERERFEKRGGRYGKRPEHLYQPNPNRNNKTISKVASRKAIPSLRELHQQYVEAHRSGNTGVLLPADERAELEHRRAESYALLRWDLTDERKRHASIAAERILKNVERYGDQISSERHIEYINREKAFAKKGGCVYRGHRLPKWAKDSPNEFFRAADRYSPENASRYREVEFALQNELTLEQNLEIIHGFIERVMPHHYYDFAVHDKIGAMADGTHNLHVHIVFSTREIDDIEERNERSPENYFKYPLRKNAKDQSEESKREHGAPMVRDWQKMTFLPHLRQTYEEVTNETLAKYGYSARVDHRSLKAQMQEAEMNGDKVLAAILNRMPEQRLGINELYEGNEEVEILQKLRKNRNVKQTILFKAEKLNHALQAKKVSMRKEEIEKRLEDLLSSGEFIESENSKDSTIEKLRTEFVDAVKKYQHLQGMIVSPDAAEERAKLEYMTEEECEVFQEWKKISEELSHWETFQNHLNEPTNGTPDELATYHDLIPALAKKITSLHNQHTILQEKIDAIENRLSNPDITKQIQLITHRALEENKFIRRDLWKAQKNLDTTMSALEQAIFAETTAENTQDIYTLHQLHKIARRRYFGLKKEKERLQNKIASAKKNVLSMERATKMAANIYTKGGMKKFNEDRRAYKKQETYLQNDLARWKEKQAAFLSRPIPQNGTKEYAAYKEEERGLQKEKATLDSKAAKLAGQKAALDALEKKLTAQIDSSQGQAKIKEIALGIVRKNQPAQKRYDGYIERLKAADERLKEAGAQLERLSALVKEAEAKGKPEQLYKVVSKKELNDTQKEKARQQKKKESDTSNPQGGMSSPARHAVSDHPSMIMKALAGDERYVSLVATTRNDDKGLKNWRLMSEMEKDEEANKNMYAELV